MTMADFTPGDMVPDVRRITVRVPDELADGIEEIAAANGVSVTALMAATMRQQVEMFEEYGRTPASEWKQHATYDRWQALVLDARAIDRERRQRHRTGDES